MSQAEHYIKPLERLHFVLSHQNDSDLSLLVSGVICATLCIQIEKSSMSQLCNLYWLAVAKPEQGLKTCSECSP